MKKKEEALYSSEVIEMMQNCNCGEHIMKFHSAEDAEVFKNLVDIMVRSGAEYVKSGNEKDLETALSAKDRACMLWNDPELTYSNSELSEIKKTGISDPHKWDELAKSSDVEMRLFANDMIAMDDAVAADRKYAYRADEKCTEAIRSALSAVAYQESLDKMDTKEMLSLANKAFAESVFPMTQEEFSKIQESLKDLGKDYSQADRIFKKAVMDDESVKKAGLDASFELAKHPLRHLAGKIMEACEEYTEAKEICHEAGEGYEIGKDKLLKICSDVVSNTYEPLRDSARLHLNEAVKELGDIAKTAYGNLTTLAKNTERSLVKMSRMLVFKCDCLLDKVTLGAYSNYCMHMNDKAADRMNRNMGMEMRQDFITKDRNRFHNIVEASIQRLVHDMDHSHAADKNEMTENDYDRICFALRNAVDKGAENVAYFGFRAQQFLNNAVVFSLSEKKDGTPYVSVDNGYWAEVKKAAHGGAPSLADKMTEAGKTVHTALKTYESNRNEAIHTIDKALNEICKDFFSEMKNAVKDLVKDAQEMGTAVKDLVKEVEDSVKDAHQLNRIDLLGSRVSAMEKYEKRTEAKVAKFQQVDRTIFESLEKINREIHSLTSPKRYESPAYRENDQLTKQIRTLRALYPTKEVKVAIRQTERAIIKERKMLEKSLEKDKAKDLKTLKNLVHQKEKLLDNKDSNMERLTSMKQKLEEIQKNKEALQKSIEVTEQKLQGTHVAAKEADQAKAEDNIRESFEYGE